MRRALAIALSLVASVGTAVEVSLPQWPPRIVWAPQYAGVGLASVTLGRPRPLQIHALRIKLDAPGLSLVTDNDNGDRPEEVDGVKTSTFLVQSGCQAAINASAFWPLQNQEGQPQNVAGLVVSAGKLVSPVDDDKPRAALVVRDDGRAAIARPPIDLEGVALGIGGYGEILRGGDVVRPDEDKPSFIDNLHPRTAVGIADGGRTLILVVVDGRQEGYSEGVSLAELGEVMRLLGADDALNLDGGGTTTMALAAPEAGFRLVNRPIHGGNPGGERVSASHLGVRAAPIAQSPQAP